MKSSNLRAAPHDLVLWQFDLAILMPVPFF